MAVSYETRYKKERGTFYPERFGEDHNSRLLHGGSEINPRKEVLRVRLGTLPFLIGPTGIALREVRSYWQSPAAGIKNRNLPCPTSNYFRNGLDLWYW